MLKSAWFYLTVPVAVCWGYSLALSVGEILIGQDAIGVASGKVLLMSLSVVIMIAIGRFTLVKDPKERVMGGLQRMVTFSLVCAVIIVLLNITTGVIGTFQVIDMRMLMFFVNIAIGEELLYRVLIANILVLILSKATRKPQNVMIGAVVIDGLIFSLAHYQVYATVPAMMIETLIAGMVYAAFYLHTRNPFVPIFAHVLNNLLATGGILLNATFMVVMA